MTVKDTIKSEINQILQEKFDIKDVGFQIEYPPKAELGDYSCNVAMILAGKLGKNPREIAGEIMREFEGAAICKDKDDNTQDGVAQFKFGEGKFCLAKIIQPGFINFYLSENFLNTQVENVLKEKENFGKLENKTPQKIQVEFISANPTGPLTLANGRGGFTGDVLANILKLAGHQVEREYYINDFGNQVKNLGLSILKNQEASENLYKGDYINELKKELRKEFNLDKLNNLEEVSKKAVELLLEKEIKPAVKKMGIEFDVWFSEKSMHEKGEVDEMLQVLKQKGLVEEKEGAVWFKTKTTGKDSDEKDRVLVKSDKNKTYFLSDIAYHWDKLNKRGFDKVIDIWGADHHGYVPRLKQAVVEIGYPEGLDVILMQLVRLIKEGQEYKMSKRAGNYVLISDLIDEVGLDVARFFFLMHSANKHMDFDFDLAKEKSSKNPVFYVQYAHARVCSILKKSESAKINESKNTLHDAEKNFITEILKWPELIAEVAKNYEVHKIAFYAISLADGFHKLYENCPVIQEGQVSLQRLNIVKATKQTLQNVLEALGVAHPESM